MGLIPPHRMVVLPRLPKGAAMPKTQEAEGAEARPSWHDIVALCASFGLFQAFCPVGTVGTACATSLAQSQGVLAIARGFFFAAMVVLMIVLTATNRSVQNLRLVRGFSNAGLLLSFPFMYSLSAMGIPDIGIVTGSILLGASSAFPFLNIFKALASIRRNHGQSFCLILLACCSLVSSAVIPLGTIVTNGRMPTALTMECLTGLFLIGSAAIHRRPVQQNARQNPSVTYRPSRTVVAITSCLGFVWAMSFSAAASCGFGEGRFNGGAWGIVMAGIIANIAMIVLATRAREELFGRFGLLLRVVICAIGTMWGFVPLFCETHPMFVCFASAASYLLVNTIMILLILELAEQFCIDVQAVAARNFVPFIIAACIATIVFGIFSSPAFPNTPVMPTASACIAALFMSVPFLPSLMSHATDFAQEELPENEGLNSRISARKTALIASCQLSAREAQIMDMLVDGLTREKIARELSLSPHTVKNHVTSLYKKTGTHSSRELIAQLIENV